jgi:flagellar hook-associated protein 2
VTEDSVQGLLSAIETSFSNQVTAAVNSNGRIIISDKTSGNSNVSLSFDCAKAHDLDFGSVLTANTDGQTGRYAMTITASADSGNRLIITHDDYGSGKSFTIHQQNNLLWTDGDQTVDNGLDVSGTINGEEATGIGQTLTGNSDSANVAGLSIKYTGTAEGLDAGTIKLIFGAAELYDRVLFNITDAYEGYVAYKQESLQNSITRYRTQIEEMEARLALKRERMINEFIRMELALQKIQSQSSWLTNQLNAVSKIWND